MIKKIFIVIGIVLGSTAAFIGATVGVLAAMGKFNTPEVYPQTLAFEENNLLIDDTDRNEEQNLFSFTLLGANSNYDTPVNKKDCYIWFDLGGDLIELVDSDGNALTIDKQNRYTINCNEKTYFKLRELNNYNKDKDGIVILSARSAGDGVPVKTSTPLTINIDRAVKGIYVDYNVQNTVNERTKTQNIQLATNAELTFNYLANPSNSLLPISTKDAKNVELYYDDPDTEGYIKLTDEKSIENYSNLFSIKDDKIVFSSAETKTYTFKIAVFPTYNAQLEYENSIDGRQENVYERLNSMFVTTLTIDVQDANVQNVYMTNNGLVLSLYSDNDYITLNGETGLNNANEHSLGLTMETEIGETYVRFDNVAFGSIGDNFVDNVSFESSMGNLTKEQAEAIDVSNFNLSNIWLSGNQVLVDYIAYNGSIYRAKNCAAVATVEFDVSGNIIGIAELQAIKSGSYLEFFTNQNNKNTLFNDVDSLEINNPFNTSGNKSWNVVSKQIVENLRLAVIVVNSEGLFNVENFVAIIPVEIRPIALVLELNDNSYTIDINYRNTTGDFVPTSTRIPVVFDGNSGVVNIKAGSYNSVVFVAEKARDYCVKVVEDFEFSLQGSNKQYVLVG